LLFFLNHFLEGKDNKEKINNAGQRMVKSRGLTSFGYSDRKNLQLSSCSLLIAAILNACL